MSYIFQNLLLMYIYQSFNCVRSMCIETVSIQSVLHGYIIRKIPHKFSHKRTVTTYPQIVWFFSKKLGRIFYMRCLNVRFQVRPFTLTFWRIQISCLRKIHKPHYLRTLNFPLLTYTFWVIRTIEYVLPFSPKMCCYDWYL